MSILFFDIETVADKSKVDTLLEIEPIEARSNLKDSEKIAADIEEKRNKIRERAALDPALCKIRSLAWSIGAEDGVHVEIVGQPRSSVREKYKLLETKVDELGKTKDESEEAKTEYLQAVESLRITKEYVETQAERLTEFELLVYINNLLFETSGRNCGYNVIGFDWPVILRRCLNHNYGMVIKPNLSRYRTEPTCDIMQILAGWDLSKARSLSTVCALDGIDYKTPYSGDQVATMTDEQVIEYQTVEVRAIKTLWLMMNGVYWGIRSA